ncbi:MAG: LacI family DNA-binding transcriptional regulator [Planctomycetota bacterium]
MSITLKDIAERAQVSQATVSIAMGSTGRISDKTRKRVLSIADELGYRPNLLVQGIQKGQTMTVGVLMAFNDHVFDVRLFNGIHETLSSANYVPIVLRPTPVLPVLQQIHSLIDRRVDGILIRPAKEAIWERHLNEALDRNLPVVSMDIETRADTPRVDFVGTDNVVGARAAADALLEAGHRRVAVVTTGVETDAMHDRAEAFASRIEEHGDATVFCVNQPWVDNTKGEDAALEILNKKPRPTAVFATMDHLAMGVYRVAHELGLRIPEDLSVAGFGANVIADELTPPLSGVRQKPEQTGARAAELLLQRIHEGDEHGKRQRIMIEPEWVNLKSIKTIGS